MNPLDLFHLTVGAEYLPVRSFPLRQPDTSAVATDYSGPGIEVQAGASFYQSTHLDLRASALFSYSALSTSSSHPTASQVSQMAVGASVAGTYLPYRNFGVGTELSLAYQCVDSSHLDIGLPFDASTECFSNGGLALGAKIYLSTFHNTVQAGAALNYMPNGFTIHNNFSYTPFQVDPSLGALVFLRVDGQIFRHF